MSLIERYIFGITHRAFWVCLLALTAVIWITSALRQLDLLTSKGQTVMVFFYMTLLTLPGLVAVAAPFTLLIAVLYALSRLNSDSELIVMNAAGIKPFTIFRPFLFLAFLVSVMVLAITLWGMPNALYTMRSLSNKIRADFITYFVQDGQFASMEGMTFHFQAKTGNVLHNMVIQNRRDSNKVTTYLAKRGHTKEVGDRWFLLLENGTVQSQSPNKTDAAIVAFSNYSIDLSGYHDAYGAGHRPAERSTVSLLYPDTGDSSYKTNRGRYVAELHERFSSGLYPFVMVFLGFACLGKAQTTRSGREAAVALAAVSAVVFRILTYAIKNSIVASPDLWGLDYALPALTILICVFIIVRNNSTLFRPKAGSRRHRTAEIMTRGATS